MRAAEDPQIIQSFRLAGQISLFRSASSCRRVVDPIDDVDRGITTALMGGGGGGGVKYSYIRVLPDEFLLKSVVFKFISKEISRAEHEYMNIYYIVDSKILKIHSEIFSISSLVKISIT